MTNLEKAIHIAKLLEKGLPDRLHIGLTGGTLYKDGERKDIDFVVYSHKCYEQINTNQLAFQLSQLGLINTVNYGRVIKGQMSVDGALVDLDFIVPESETGEYVEEEEANSHHEYTKKNTVTMIHPHNGDEVVMPMPTK